MTEKLTCPASVRCARQTDEEPLFAFLQIMHAENGMAPIDEREVRLILRKGIARDHGIIGVIRGEGGIEASCGLYVGKWWYTSLQHKHLEDFWCFVHPDHRRTSHAKDLLAFTKWAAQECGYPLLMGVLSTARTAPKVRLYQRQLGEPAGALFVLGTKVPADDGAGA